jgi:hypothetical protein
VVRSTRSLLAVLVAAGVGASSAVPATAPRRPIPDRARTTILVWGDGLFTTRAGLDRWLRRHGETYVAWKRTHPAARAILGQAATPVTFRSSQLPPKGPPVSAGPEVTVAAPSTASRALVEALILTFAGALLMLGALPVRRVVVNLELAAALDRRRPALAIAGAAIILGLAIARLFG